MSARRLARKVGMVGVVGEQLARQSNLTFQLSKNVHQAARQASNTTNTQIRQRRSSMFSEEKERQVNSIPRLEKIEVLYQGVPEEATLILNKDISTPYHVAQHLTEMLCDRSALARLDGDKLWDMHRPLEEDCTIELLHFHSENPFHCNRAFWRSCSLLLGAAVEAAMSEEVTVHQHSFPPPNVSSGSFVADIDLGFGHTWEPTRQELMSISAVMHKLAERKLPFERLVVSEAVALEIFRENPHKTSQIPSIAEKEGRVTLYRVGDHVDISAGPMMGDSSFLGRRCTIPVAHRVVQGDTPVYRFQGVALPRGVYLNHFAFGVLEERAARLNLAGLAGTRPTNPV